MTNDLLALAQTINGKDNDPIGGLRLRRGVVTAISISTSIATVTIGGTSVSAPCDRGALPVVGDTVDVLIDGPAPRVIGITTAITWLTVGAGGAPGFVNSWTQEADRPLSFGRDADGFVHIRGKAKSGVDLTVFTLPSGYRPAANEDFPIVWNAATSLGQCKVQSNGEVRAYGVSSGSNWVTFSGITFLADGS